MNDLRERIRKVMQENGPSTAWPRLALADELKAAADRGETDDGSHYYEHWLAALERLVTSKHLTDHGALSSRKQEWVDAYRHTPHGKPVELRKSENSFEESK